MFEYTKDNFIQFGYNSRPFQFRKETTDQFFVRYGRAQRPPMDFKSELMHTAKLIQNLAQNKPIVVLFSGGLDSELVLRSFLEADVPVKAATMRFSKDLNLHDIQYAIDFCHSNKITHDVYELDIEHFLKNDLSSYAAPVMCPSPQFPAILWLLDQIEGFPVIASGDTFLKRAESTNDFTFYEREKYFSYYYHLIRSERPGVPAFLQYTPELLLSFLLDPTLKEYVSHRAKKEKLLSISKYKYDIYSSHFDLKHREVVNGFEKIQDLDRHYRSELKSKFPSSDTSISIPYKHFIDMLSP